MPAILAAICGTCGKRIAPTSKAPWWVHADTRKTTCGVAHPDTPTSMSDQSIIEKIKTFGVDYPRLHNALEQKDNWGALVNSFVYLTVLGVVEDAMKKDHAATLERQDQERST
jgi:hypothetical protein